MQEDGPHFRILGPLEVRSRGATIPVRSRLQRLLLSIFLLDAGRLVSSGRLADELWGDHLPHDPSGALRTQVSRLRRSLPTVAEVHSEPGGYRLTVDADEIDARRFEQLVAGARTRPGADALRLLDEAVELWRGPPLDEFVDRAFAQVEQRRLGELQGAAHEQRAELLLAAGRATDAVAASEAVLADHPDREHARALLMEALYQSGRATDALAIYQSRNRELGEHGLEPSPELRDMELGILRHTITEPVRAARVPRPVSTFIGSDTIVSGVADLLATTRLVTLWGAGGVGKTRLSLEVSAVVGDRYRDGVHLCDLSTLVAGSDVARAIANSVGISERSGRRLESQLVDRLSGRHLLLILDNCEHVLDTTAAIAQSILLGTSGVVVLATSRERLGVDGEHLWEVRPLDASGPDSPAVALFADRAAATNPSWHPSIDDREVIAEICQRLDGLPLAVELAAARTRGLSLGELLDALETRPELLRGGAATPLRHRSLRAVIDWSYSLLTPVQQRVFDRLAIFRGGFGLDAASAVASDDDLADTVVARAVLGLLDRALLVERTDDPTRRYTMLDVVRRYGLEHLEAQGALDHAAERHAHWFLTQTEGAAGSLGSADEPAAARSIESSVDELRAAHRWLVGHDLERSLRLIAALRPYAHWRGQSEMFRWADVSAAAAASTNAPLLPEVLLAAATGAWQRGDLDAARAAAGAISAVDAHARRAALDASADVALLDGDLARARAEFIDAHELALADGDELQAVWELGSAAVAAGYAGDTESALRLADQTRVIADRCGSPSARAFAQFAIGEIVTETSPDDAEVHLSRALDMAGHADTRFVAGLAEVSLAALHGRRDDVDTALTHCRSALDRWHRSGAWTPLWVTMRTVVAVLQRAASLEDAATLLAATQSARSGAAPFGADVVTMREAADHLRNALGANMFDRYAERGRAMTEEETLRFAVHALERAQDTTKMSVAG